MLIRLQHVSKTYVGPEGEVRALRDVCLDVRHGEFVAVEGQSGSGKTTLLNILGLLDWLTEGAYTLDGVETHRLNAVQQARLRARSIGFVFQRFHLLSTRSALHNVARGLEYREDVGRREALNRAAEALDAVQLSDRLNHLPRQLSGGQQQRVAIARAIVGNPRLLLADEPTGNLDSVSATGILGLFEDLHRRGTTIILVTHNAHVAARCIRRIEVIDGCLRESAA